MWNGRVAEIWTLVTMSPESFKGGGIWNVVVSINGGLKAIGYGLLVLFFVTGVMKSAGSFTEINISPGNNKHILTCTVCMPCKKYLTVFDYNSCYAFCVVCFIFHCYVLLYLRI